MINWSLTNKYGVLVRCDLDIEPCFRHVIYDAEVKELPAGIVSVEMGELPLGTSYKARVLQAWLKHNIFLTEEPEAGRYR